MAATGYTPIQLYRTSTSGASPTSGNLNAGELAINYNTADMSVWALNTGGSVIRLMNNPAGLKYPTVDGTANQVIKTDGAGNLTFVTPSSGGLSAATQAEMEAATSNTVAATPLNTKWHPGVAKMWLKANISGGINASYNVASITDAGVGKLNITYTTSFSSANYALSYAIQSGSGLSLWFEQGNVTASGCSAYAGTFAGTYADPGTAYFISAFGDQ